MIEGLFTGNSFIEISTNFKHPPANNKNIKNRKQFLNVLLSIFLSPPPFPRTISQLVQKSFRRIRPSFF